MGICEVEADAVEAQVASVREDGLTHFICLTFDIIVWMFSCTRQFFTCQTWERHTLDRAHFVECGTSASLSLDGMLRIFLSKNANPMVLHLSGMRVCHHDTPVHTEDTTSF